MATIIANGSPHDVSLPWTVAQLLESCGWKPTQVVVELNGNVMDRNVLADRQLQDGDRVEIIVPVAGG